MAICSQTAGSDAATKLTVLMLWLLLAAFVVYPLARLLLMAFTADGSFTLANLRPFIDSWYDRQAAVNSILLGCSVGLAGTVLGFIFAYAVTRLSMPKWLKMAVSAVTLLPLISPPFTSSIALTLSLGPNGILLELLGLGNFNFYGFPAPSTASWRSPPRRRAARPRAYRCRQ
jgi:iron(III) transport system permease protein